MKSTPPSHQLPKQCGDTEGMVFGFVPNATRTIKRYGHEGLTNNLDQELNEEDQKLFHASPLCGHLTFALSGRRRRSALERAVRPHSMCHLSKAKRRCTTESAPKQSGCAKTTSRTSSGVTSGR